MRIFIPTFGRSDRQLTLYTLPPDIQAKVELVVRLEEYTLYRGYQTRVLPTSVPPNIGSVRQYLLETFPTEKICMLDDDLVFAVRRGDDPTKFREPDSLDMYKMFRMLEIQLDLGYALVGIAAREGANRLTTSYSVAARAMRVHAINASVYHRLGIRYDRMSLMEDFDVILQFLEAGHPNIVLNDWVSNQAGSNTEGGCSAYRTLERQAEAAQQLKAFHPDFVKVVKKRTKTSWGGQERTDVIVQWKRAIAAGRTRLLDRGKGEHSFGEGEGPAEAMVE